MRRTFVLPFTFAIVSLSAHAQPKIRVTPPEVLEGAPIHIVVNA